MHYEIKQQLSLIELSLVQSLFGESEVGVTYFILEIL